MEAPTLGWLAQGGQKKDTQAPATGATTMDELVMERRSTQWRDGQESKAGQFVHWEEKWDWRPDGSEEQADMRNHGATLAQVAAKGHVWIHTCCFWGLC